MRVQRTRNTPNRFIAEGEICRIQLYNKDQEVVGEALIDRWNRRRCRPYKWSLNGGGYVGAKVKGKTVFLHNHIMGVEGSYIIQTDHRNRIRTDCREENLRVCSSGQNKMNRVSKKTYSSKYRGVSFDRKSGKWRVSVTAEGCQHYIGSYKGEIGAAKAFDKAALKLQGEFAVLNFEKRTKCKNK